MRGLVRHPLAQLIAVGLALFGLRQAVPRAVRDAAVIVVPAGYVEGLNRRRLAEAGLPASRDEIAAAVAAYVDEELLYREALALGLDRGDATLRRHLIQKMEFFSLREGRVEEPTDAELRAHLGARPERFRLPADVRFRHVRAADEARARPGAAAETVPARTREQLAALFGPAFAGAIFELPVGAWAGPIASAHGWHAVIVDERRPERAPRLEEVRAQVADDLRRERQQAQVRAAVEALRRKYEVRVEGAS